MSKLTALTRAQAAVLEKVLRASSRNSAPHDSHVLTGADLRTAKRLMSMGMLARRHHPCSTSWAFSLTAIGSLHLLQSQGEEPQPAQPAAPSKIWAIQRQQVLEQLDRMRARVAALQSADEVNPGDLARILNELDEVHVLGRLSTAKGNNR